ncbi:MAG: LacI family transcriptional regulator [Promicromonosporaceae bacterium]|nr:LacI family transcriptional regulator [Promicromonosporaceae bacterium]
MSEQSATEATSRRPRHAAISDIAELAGVSNMTVSRVINDKPGVGEDTRRRILDLIREHDFRLNASARALKTGRPNTLGVICLSTTLPGPTATLFGVERTARAHGYGVSILSLEDLDEASVLEAMGKLDQVPVAAVVIIAPTRLSEAALHGAAAELPVVAIWAPSESGVAVAAMDHPTAAREATQHLLDLGHATVHHISGPANWTGTEQRIAGWRQALEAAGAPIPPVIEGDWSAESGANAMRTLLAAGIDRVTAIFAANDQMALGAMSVCYQNGLPIPERISIIGYDDLPDAAYYSPPLTSVRQSFSVVAERAVAMALARIDGTELPDQGLVHLPLVVRASTAPAPALP